MTERDLWIKELEKQSQAWLESQVKDLIDWNQHNLEVAQMWEDKAHQLTLDNMRLRQRLDRLEQSWPNGYFAT